MRKTTTTKKIYEAISNNLLHITKAEVNYKTSGKTETIDDERTDEIFSFLCETGIFADCIGWHYELDCKSHGYIAECGRMNPDSEVIISVYLSVCHDVIGEDIEKVLEVIEEE